MSSEDLLLPEVMLIKIYTRNPSKQKNVCFILDTFDFALGALSILIRHRCKIGKLQYHYRTPVPLSLLVK